MADHRALGPDDQRCIDLVNMVTDYLDGALSEGQRRSTEQHLHGCEACRVALEQFQTVIRLTGRLTPKDVATIDALARDRLMATLRVARRR